MHAFCYASGQIGFGASIPAGALPIATGPSEKLIAWIGGVARHAYDGDTLLVPGVPEAPDQLAGVEAMQKWVDWIGNGAPEECGTYRQAGERKRGVVRRPAKTK